MAEQKRGKTIYTHLKHDGVKMDETGFAYDQYFVFAVFTLGEGISYIAVATVGGSWRRRLPPRRDDGFS
jgi:hypothetical protein